MTTPEALKKRSRPVTDVEHQPASNTAELARDFFPQKRTRKDDSFTSFAKMSKEEQETFQEELDERVQSYMIDYVSGVRDEREELLKDLKSGKYTLFLEHERNATCKCRADNCVAGGYVGSIYRLNLQRKESRPYWENPRALNRRFFHITCFEQIGIDLEDYIALAVPYRPQDRFYEEGSFDCHYHHPAIVDWVENKGNTFALEDYDTNISLKAAFKTFDAAIDSRLDEHDRKCRTECVCGLHDRDYPVSKNHISGEASKRRLSDIMLDTLKVNHLIKDFTEEERKILLEVFGEVVRYRKEIPEEFFIYMARYGMKQIESAGGKTETLKSEYHDDHASTPSTDSNKLHGE